MAYLSKTFTDRATLYRKGDIDQDNGYTFKADCYNLRIDKLSPCHAIQKLEQSYFC